MGGYQASTLSEYQAVLKNFKDYINNIRNNPYSKGDIHNGYLVNYAHYDNFKSTVEKGIMQQNKNPHSPQTEKNDNIIINSIEKNKCKTESLANVISLIQKDYKFIIINTDTYNSICKQIEQEKEANKIKYSISNGMLILYREKGKEIKFKDNNNNIIDKTSLLENIINNKNDNDTSKNNSIKDLRQESQNWESILTDVNNYYSYEKFILEKLNEKQSNIIQAYLINTNWVENWKKYSYYDSIKANFLSINITDKLTIKNFILNKQSKTKLNYDDIKIDAEKDILKNSNQICDIPSTKESYVLLEGKFLKRFLQDSNIAPTYFIIENQTITINIPNRKDLKFKTDNNIIGHHNFIGMNNQISSNYNNNHTKMKYLSYNLMHLIRYHYFKKEIKSAINLSQNQFKSFYLINNQIINNFKQIYDLNQLFIILDKQNLLREITYNNCNDYYNKINDFLNKDKIQYITHLQKHEIPGGIKFKGNEIIFTPKLINNQPNLKYIDNFEIIDQEYSNFLLQKFGENLLMYQAYYATIEGKIILGIDFLETDIFEIVSLNSENIIVEYLIEIITPSAIKNFSYDKKSLNNAIFKLISTFGIQKLSSEENPTPVENNVSMKLYPINGIRITNIKTNKNNSHNTMVIGPPQLTGFNNINNFQLQNQINGTFNTFSQSQIQGINNLNTFNFATNPTTGITQIESYFLIDKELFHLLSPNLNQINNNNYSTTKLVLKKLPQNQNNINGINFDSYKIKSSRKEFHKKVFNFPENFQIINLNDSIRILQILANNQIKNELLEEICLTQINGGIVFMPKEINSKISNNLIYIYSNKTKGHKNIIEPIGVIECIDFSDRNKKFLRISPNVTCKNILLNPKALSSKCYLYNDIIQNNDILRTSIGPSFNLNPLIDSNQKGNQNISQSERFKVIVLLAISQIFDYSESKEDKVHLINPKWLDKYNFQEIKSLIESKSNEIYYLWNKKYNLNSIAPIINILDQTKIQLFCCQMNLNEPNSFIASSDEMALADKYIYLYKSFVLVNGSIFKLFQKEISLFLKIIYHIIHKIPIKYKI